MFKTSHTWLLHPWQTAFSTATGVSYVIVWMSQIIIHQNNFDRNKQKIHEQRKHEPDK